MSTGTENIQSIIQLLQDLDKNNAYSVYLPSQQRELNFKQLNTEQYKRLIKTVVDSPIYNTEFIITTNAIIKENIIDLNIDTNKLNIYDKLLFLIKTRIACISPEYTFTFTDEEIEKDKLTENKFTINLANIYNDFTNNFKEYPSKEYTNNEYSILCALPTLETENKLEKELHKNTALEINTPEELRTTVGDTFINELSKYIDVLKIKENTLLLNTLSFKTRVKVVEQLPTSAINNVLKYIEGYKKITEPLTVHNLDIQGVNFVKDLPLDATLFNL